MSCCAITSHHITRSISHTTPPSHCMTRLQQGEHKAHQISITPSTHRHHLRRECPGDPSFLPHSLGLQVDAKLLRGDVTLGVHDAVVRHSDQLVSSLLALSFHDILTLLLMTAGRQAGAYIPAYNMKTRQYEYATVIHRPVILPGVLYLSILVRYMFLINEGADLKTHGLYGHIHPLKHVCKR